MPTSGIDTLSVYGYDATDTIFGIPPGFWSSARTYSSTNDMEQKIWTAYEGKERHASNMKKAG